MTTKFVFFFRIALLLLISLGTSGALVSHWRTEMIAPESWLNLQLVSSVNDHFALINLI